MDLEDFSYEGGIGNLQHRLEFLVYQDALLYRFSFSHVSID